MPHWKYRRASDVAIVALALAADLAVWGGEDELRDNAAAPPWIVPVLASCVFLTLFFRRRQPVAVFGIQWTWGLIGLAIPGYEPFAGVLVALYSVARQLESRTALAALVSCGVPFGIDSYDVTLKAPGQRVLSFVVSAAIWLLIAAGVWALGRVSYRSDTREIATRRAHDAQLELTLQQERTRVAHELHDIVANAVSTMILQAAGAKTLLAEGDAPIKQALTTVETTGVQAMNELHRLLRLLRPGDAELQHYDPSPSVTDVGELLDRARASGLVVLVSSDGDRRALDPSVDLAGYRVVQEGLTNTAKHAGPSATVHVELCWRTEELSITVRDDGGLDSAPGELPDERRGRTDELSGGFGLRGLSERVSLVGGRLQSGQTAGGFVLRAHLPVIPQLTGAISTPGTSP